jgi:hypothetical protein
LIVFCSQSFGFVPFLHYPLQVPPTLPFLLHHRHLPLPFQLLITSSSSFVFLIKPSLQLEAANQRALTTIQLPRSYFSNSHHGRQSTNKPPSSHHLHHSNSRARAPLLLQ